VRFNPHHATDDPEFVRALIAANPWATIVSDNDGRLVASHYPILLDDAREALGIVTHVGRPDEQVHDFGDRELLIIVQGRHGYISPSWYASGATRAPTWNFSVAHCHGIPEILSPEENLGVLARLVVHFERHVDAPVLLDAETGARLAPGTVGIRVAITRFECKRKLSQDKDPVSRRQVIAALRADGPYANPGLADEMEQLMDGSSGG
jgi:transcriptional regulator